MCFTAREQAVRRRRPASYSSHSVDRRLWRRVYFFRCNREVPASDSKRTPMFTRTASSWRRYSSWYMFSRPWLALLLRRACQTANPRRRCSFALAVWTPTTPRAATQCCPARCAGRNPSAAPPCHRCYYYYCRLKAYIVLTFLTLTGISPANRSRSGPKSVHMHRSRVSNDHEILGAIGCVGEMGAKKCPGHVSFL